MSTNATEIQPQEEGSSHLTKALRRKRTFHQSWVTIPSPTLSQLKKLQEDERIRAVVFTKNKKELNVVESAKCSCHIQ